MIKLTKLTFELKDESQQRYDDIQMSYNEALEYSETHNLEKPRPPKPIRFKNSDFNIHESVYYLDPNLIEEIYSDNENTTILSIVGREVSVKETPEEVYNLKQEHVDSK